MEAVTFKKAVYISHMYCTGHKRFNIRLATTEKRNNRLEIMKMTINIVLWLLGWFAMQICQ